ncbi:hypothetical protein KTO58_20565 [Chitinophaga pendula]|uniref:hypothetical protein n=1 Tax=Chitinophaga TaxID=79328 RepID=UPI000BAF6A60|nr:MULTISPECIES: hypothetical protein [Chitinophaga]ASZ10963.1 hypothetical protein CK934_08240 [Chitinophaga sp. MD30]UCJ06046.1 hypothetical protein KTO58_20565 [Chitinophaga pendula]
MRSVFTYLIILLITASSIGCQPERGANFDPFFPVSPPPDFRLKELIVKPTTIQQDQNIRHYQLHYNNANNLDSVIITEETPGTLRAGYYISYAGDNRITTVAYKEKGENVATGNKYVYNNNGNIIAYDYWDTELYILTPKIAAIQRDGAGRITVLPEGDSLFYDNGFNVARMKQADGTVAAYEYEYRANPLYYVRNWSAILFREPWLYQLALSANNVHLISQGKDTLATCNNNYDEKERLIKTTISGRRIIPAASISYTYY